MRLDKYLTDCTGNLRSVIKNDIKKICVTVNGESVRDPGFQIKEMSDVVTYRGETIVYQKNRYYMFYKPMDCVTAKTDNLHKTVFDYIKEKNKTTLIAVGRLDKDTEGLLLLTDDGDFCHALMSPKKHVRKVYYFEAFGTLIEEDIQKLEKGIYLINEGIDTLPANVTDVVNNGTTVSGNIEITEGKFHQIKRMLQSVGCTVTYLKRTQIGNVSLDETLQPGQYRELTKEELTQLYE